MTRREFLKSIAIVGVGTSLMPKKIVAETIDSASMPDLVAIKGGQPGAMFDRAIKAFGGMRKFVKRGDSVVIKPNVSWNQPPETAANTNPQLVKRVIEHCIDAGASKVYVVDRTIDNWELTYKTSGIKAPVEEAGGQIVPAFTERYYQSVPIRGGVTLKSVKVHEIVMEADCLINIPILKHHSSTKVTSALKNLMGLVWDRGFYHRSGLNQCIADFPLYRKPDLNIVDAYNVLMSGGPRGSSSRAAVSQKRFQLVSPDIVAVDAAAVKVWNPDTAVSSVSYIPMAEKNRVGSSQLEDLNIERISL